METIRRVFQIVGGLACALLAIGGLGWSWKSMMKKSKEQADKKMPQQYLEEKTSPRGSGGAGWEIGCYKEIVDESPLKQL